MLKLEIPNRIFEDMLEQARAEAPIECCGILAGSGRRVEKLYKMTNAEHRRDHYMMAPEQQFEAVKDIRSNALDMLAIYHSHPETPARPSVEDIRLAYDPDISFVIVSLAKEEPQVKSFLIRKGKSLEEDIEIIE